MKRFSPQVPFLAAIAALFLFVSAYGSGRATAPKSPIQNPKSEDWLSAVQSDIRQSEYHVTWQEYRHPAGASLPSAAYQAPNCAHNLRTYFTPEGITVMPRTEGIANGANEANFVLSWRLVEVDPAAEPVVSGNRIEYQRGDLTEWYVNDKKGLEQGFTIQSPPHPLTLSPLLLDLSLSTTLTPTLTADGRAIEFTNANGVTILRYGELQATDAAGRDLTVSVGARQAGVSIAVETAGAVFPITIQAQLTSPAAGNTVETFTRGPNWTAESDQAGAQFGHSVGTAGDVNGDGYAEVIIGATQYDGGQSNEGRAYVYYGSASGLSLNPDWTFESDNDEAFLGSAVSTAGDVNRDGYADVIVGARYYTWDQYAQGAAFVFHGSPSGLSLTPDWTVYGDQASAYLGYAAGSAGDVNGDGYAGVIVGVPSYNNPLVDEGKVLVYQGSAAGLSVVPDWTAEGQQANAGFGNSVGTAGDVNGDGYADIIIGVSVYNNPEEDEGRAFVYHGSASGLNTTPDWIAESDQEYADFGVSVGTAGDVNGDGYAEAIVGADTYDNGQTNEGAAFLYYGNEGLGLSLNPRQRRSDDSAPIAHLGMADSNAFRLALLGRTPFGRGLVKLQWEVKELDEPFNGMGLGESADWMDTGTAGIELNELVSDLAADTVHHWRVRLLYHPATTPFQQYGRWLTMPWNGWNEADLRTGPEIGPTPTPIPPTPTPIGTPPRRHQRARRLRPGRPNYSYPCYRTNVWIIFRQPSR